MIQKIRDNIGWIISIFSLLCLLGGGWLRFETKFALADDQRRTQKQLDTHMLNEYIKSLEQRIWVIKERHGEVPRDKTVKEELKDLQEKKAKQEKKLDKLESE